MKSGRGRLYEMCQRGRLNEECQGGRLYEKWERFVL